LGRLFCGEGPNSLWARPELGFEFARAAQIAVHQHGIEFRFGLKLQAGPAGAGRCDGRGAVVPAARRGMLPLQFGKRPAV